METTEQETAGRSDWERGCWEMAGAVMYRRDTQSAQIALGCAHRKKHEQKQYRGTVLVPSLTLTGPCEAAPPM